MKSIGNFLWFFFGGGLLTAITWWFFGILAFISIVGIPWARACMLMGNFACLPFGKDAINRKTLTKQGDIGTGFLGIIGNIIWFVVAGAWIAIAHALAAIACFITIIGIPFAVQHLKLAGLALSPIGKDIVPIEIINTAHKVNAEQRINDLRNIQSNQLLINCNACGGTVSVNSANCPHCGEPTENTLQASDNEIEKVSLFGKTFGIVIWMAIVLTFVALIAGLIMDAKKSELKTNSLQSTAKNSIQPIEPITQLNQELPRDQKNDTFDIEQKNKLNEYSGSDCIAQKNCDRETSSPDQQKTEHETSRGLNTKSLEFSKIDEMITASVLGDESRVIKIKTEIESLPKPTKGNRKLARSLNDKGLNDINVGDFEDAITSLIAACEADPTDSEIASNLGYAYLKSDNKSQAEIPILKSLMLNPGRTAAWTNLAEVLSEKGDLRTTIAILNLAFLYSKNIEKTKEYFQKFLIDEQQNVNLASAAKQSLIDQGIKPVTN